jgi:hypothetical protein
MEPTDDDYVNHAIIKPPENDVDKESNKRITRFVVDSRERDTSLFPFPNHYEIIFEDDIDDVISAKLLITDIPFRTYIVNKYFKKIIFSMSGTEYTVSLDEGDYTPVELASHIEQKMNASIADTFQVTYNARKDNFVFASKQPLSLNFDMPNSMCYLLGFSKKQYNSVGGGSAPFTNVVAAEFRKNFEYCNYIVMNIDQFDINKSKTNLIQRSFAVIPKDLSRLNLTDDFNIKKHFSPPIPRLHKLRVRMFDPYGNPYDFQNADHRFEIEFTSFKQKRKYQQIFVNR